jgi:hypothetical protein
MPFYNFKRKVKFYVVVDGLKYLVDIFPDVSFSQTFKEESRRVKTLHAQTNMFDDASITEANPANFDFTMPLYTTLETQPILDLLLNYDEDNTSEVTLKTFDIYVDTGEEIFELEKAVFERGVFNINKADVVSVSISGTASKLIKIGPSGITIPGVQQPTTDENSIFVEPRYMLVQVAGETQPSIHAVSFEVANEVRWLPNNTLHKSLAVTGPSDTSYPEGFVVSGRTMSGVIQQYLTEENIDNAQTWAIGVPLNIWTANVIDDYNLMLTMPEVVYTNRIETGDLFFQTYDFRSTYNPAIGISIVDYIQAFAMLLLEGDMQSGEDFILLEGDMQDGEDNLVLEGAY